MCCIIRAAPDLAASETAMVGAGVALLAPATAAAALFASRADASGAAAAEPGTGGGAIVEPVAAVRFIVASAATAAVASCAAAAVVADVLRGFTTMGAAPSWRAAAAAAEGFVAELRFIAGAAPDDAAPPDLT
jgi:hypothetical protein